MRDDIMNKQDLFKMFVLAAAVVMVVSMFAPSILQRSGGASQQGEVVEGIVDFNGTIRTYDPFLAVSVSTNESVLELLKSHEGYKSMAFFTDSVMINTTTRDDVYDLAVLLKEHDVDSYSIANVALPPVLFVETADGGMIEVSSGISVVRVPMPILFEPDTTVSIKMIAGVVENQLYGYSNPILLSEEKEIAVNATVLSEESRLYTYTIPWEERRKVEVEDIEEYGEVDYELRNTVLFSIPLTSEEVIAKKSLSYITYIDMYSIETSGDFDDSGQIDSDFPENEPTYPDSVLSVRTNESIDLDWDYDVLFTYSAALPDSSGGIWIGGGNVTVDSPEEAGVNETILLNVSGVVMGDSFVKITKITT